MCTVTVLRLYEPHKPLVLIVMRVRLRHHNRLHLNIIRLSRLYYQTVSLIVTVNRPGTTRYSSCPS